MKGPVLSIGLLAAGAVLAGALTRTVATPAPHLLAATVTRAPGFGGTADDLPPAGSATRQGWSGDWIATLSSGDCKGIASGDRTWCDTNDCKGVASKDRTWCDSAQCKAIASGDRTWCP